MKLFAPLAALASRSPAVRNFAPSIYPSGGSSTAGAFGATPQQSYLAFSRAYTNNEIVFAAIEMLATSAGEPHIVGRRWQRESPQIRNEEQRLLAAGISRRDVQARLITNGFFRDLPQHPLIRLLAAPNPWMSRGQLWGTVVMDRALAGNSYLLKSRVQDGPMRGAIRELWRLRPDRVRIIPDATNFIAGYEYTVGRDKITFPAADVVHFKTRHPLNDYYGMPPLMAVAGRVNIDEFMKTFLRRFYEGGGTGPGSILNVKQKVPPEQKEEIRERFKRQFGGAMGFHEMLILDNAESTYTQMGLNRGLRDALPKEIDNVNEARIAMAFGIPGSILGLLIGYESSSYANKRQDWQVFWDLTMAPLLSDLDDALNLQLVPDFGGTIDEVLFDLSDIRALQEDVDKIQERHRRNVSAGLEFWEEAREALGLDPEGEGTLLVPSNMVPVLVKRGGGIALPEAPAPEIPERTGAATEDRVEIVAEVHCQKCGRWVGRNMNVGAVAYCPKDKEVLVGGLTSP